MSAAALAAFFLQLLPVFRELATELFRRHKGDVKAAAVTVRTTIKRIENHGAQLDEFEAEINRRMDELERLRAELAEARGQAPAGGRA